MRLILLVAAIVFAAFSSIAAPCLPAPLSTYTAAGFTCEVDAAVFSDFSFFLQNDDAGDVLGEDDITVSPLTEAGAVGLRFSGAFQATGGPDEPSAAGGIQINEYRFFFEVTRAGSVLTSVISTLNDPQRVVYNPLKFGNIFASNNATNDGALSIADDDDPDLTDDDTLNSERLFVTADTLIHLAAGASAEGTVAPVGYASISSADFLFGYRELPPEVPEPGSWLMGLSAIACLAGYHRLRR